MLNVQGLNKKRGEFSLVDISFNVQKGEILGLVGENGAGKTTIVQLLTNCLKPDGGCISLFDNSLDSAEREIKRKIGLVSDSNYFCSDWTAVACEKAISGFFSNWDSELYYSLLDTLNVPTDLKIPKLSHGTQMKLMLCVAMSHKAELLILDEPTSGLDPVIRDDLLRVLKAYVQDNSASAIFSTHIMLDVEKIADKIAMMFCGRLLFFGTKQELGETFVSFECKDIPADMISMEKISRISSNGEYKKFVARKQDATLLADIVTLNPATTEDVLLAASKHKGRGL